MRVYTYSEARQKLAQGEILAAIRERFERVLAKVPNREPIEGEEL